MVHFVEKIDGDKEEKKVRGRWEEVSTDRRCERTIRSEQGREGRRREDQNGVRGVW